MSTYLRTRSLLSRHAHAPPTWTSLFRSYRVAKSSPSSSKSEKAKPPPPPEPEPEPEPAVVPTTAAEVEEVPTSGISRPLSEILQVLGKKVPDSIIRTRVEGGIPIRYIPWHFINRILNVHTPEWSGEVRSIGYSADGKTVSVIYRVTLYGTDAEIYREATGTASTSDTGYGDPVQKAEAMAFRRACARLGLGLHLYHEDSA